MSKSPYEVVKRLSEVHLFDVPDETIFSQRPELEVFKVLIEEPFVHREFYLPGFNFKFVLAPLREFEQRIVAMRIANYDNATKELLKRIEVLTYSIVAIVTPSGTAFEFLDIHEKIILRNLLLSFPPDIVEYLYLAYQLVEAEQKKRISEIIGGNPQEVLAKGFFQEAMDISKNNPIPNI